MAHMKRSVSILLGILLAAAVLLAADKNQPQLRELTGMVTDHNDAPVTRAIVYLKNSKTLTVTTFITGEDGKYRFPSLSRNVDYEVHAQREGKKSSAKTLSAFDSRSQATINLKIEP
jgi:hypothetical protein